MQDKNSHLLVRFLGLAITAIVALVMLGQSTPNAVVTENARPGTTAWVITDAATGPGQIEGYASAPSVNRGGQLTFYVNTTETTYTLQVFRLGYYAGLGGRQEIGPVTLTGSQQVVPSPDPTTGIVDCNWTPAYTLTTSNPNDPTDWVSGYYVVLLTGQTTGVQQYIPFVVRDDSRNSAILFQSSFNTSHAYNAWGGKSLYTYNSTQGIAAVKVSYNRPFDDGQGTGLFISYEQDMLAFLEQQGYDVSYATDLDVALNAAGLFTHKAILDVGHGEYWSWQMRQNVQAALNGGVSLGFFGANMMYWQIRYESSPATGAANRVIVCYKTLADSEDPDAANPSTYYLITDLWRNIKITYPAMPEAEVIGEMYNGQEPMNVPVVVTDASHPFFTGTGLSNGSQMAGLQGYEADNIYPGISPANVVQLAHSPYTISGVSYSADMSTYQAPSGALVFATGSMYFQYGLSNLSPWSPSPSVVNPAAQRLVNNVLAAFLSANTTPVTPTPTPTPGGGAITLRDVTLAGTTGAASSITINAPSGIQPGDVLVAQLAVRGGSGQSPVAPAGWSQVRRDNSGSSLAQIIYSHVVPWWPAEPSTYTWTFGGGNNAGIGIADYVGVSNSNPVDANSGTTASNSTSIVAPAMTVPAADTGDQALFLFSSAESTGFVLPFDTNSEYGMIAPSGGVEFGMSDLPLTTGGATASQTATSYASGPNVGEQIALLPGPIAPEPSIYLRGVATGSTAAAASSVTVNLPTGTEAGDLLLAQVAVRGGSGQNVVAPSGWTQVRRDYSGSSIVQVIYTHIAGSAEPASYTWTFAAGNNATAGIADFFGASTATPVDVSNGLGAAASTSIVAPSVTIPATSTADHLVCFFATAGGVAPVTPTGTTSEWSFRATSYGIGQAMSDIAVLPSGTTAAETATTSTAYANVGAQVALY